MEIERYEGTLEEYRPRILLAPEDAKALDDALRANMRAVLQEGTDYGVIPNTGDKPALMKPGAEKLLQWFGFGHVIEQVSIERDGDGKREGVTYRCTVTKELADGRRAVVGQCDGYTGYDEDKFFTPPEVAEARERANAEKYQRSVNKLKFSGYRAPWNSLVKMAQKRALVGAALVATSASGLFTQDMEDAVPVVSAEQAARAALRSQPRLLQDKVMEWARQQGWPHADRWEPGQWAQALIRLGELRAETPMREVAEHEQAAPDARPGESSATPQDDPWYGDRQEYEPPGDDAQWATSATERAATFEAREDGEALWADLLERRKQNRIGQDDYEKLKALLGARMAEVAAAQVLEGAVIDTYGLDPDDPWLEKIQSISDQHDVDAALADAQRQINSGTLSRKRGAQVIDAIAKRGNRLAVRGAAA